MDFVRLETRKDISVNTKKKYVIESTENLTKEIMRLEKKLFNQIRKRIDMI